METPQNPKYSSTVANRVKNRDRLRHAQSPTRYESGGVRNRPMILLTGLWLVLLVVGWMSMSEIISPGIDAPMPKTPIAKVEQDQNSSFGVLGAVAASCAVLSLLLSHRFDRH